MLPNGESMGGVGKIDDQSPAPGDGVRECRLNTDFQGAIFPMPRQTLAKSMLTRLRHQPVSCEVLYAQAGRSARGVEVPAHVHPFWQYELVLAGRCVCTVAERDIALGVGDALLIPAGLRHRLIYTAALTRHVSYKGAVSGPALPLSPVLLPARAPWNTLGQSLAALVTGDSALRSRAAPVRQETAGHLLAALIALASAAQPVTEAPAPSLMARIRTLIDQGEGRAWTVTAIARELALSPGHVSARFRAETGLVLKEFLDQARMEAAAQLLAYSEASVGEIADRMDFPAVADFSRFFKRVAGQSPQAYRRALPGR